MKRSGSSANPLDPFRPPAPGSRLCDTIVRSPALRPPSYRAHKRGLARAYTRFRMQRATKALRAMRRHLKALCRQQQVALERAFFEEAFTPVLRLTHTAGGKHP